MSANATIDELVVLSGKGGTGKTSITASFAVLAGQAVIADCDVDAADLHLVLSPRARERHEFWSGREAVIRQADCIGCGECLENCRFGAIRPTFSVDPVSCEGCGVCVRFCPANAIDFPERRCGEWMVSDTRCGTLVHARLGVAAENSGKRFPRSGARLGPSPRRPAVRSSSWTGRPASDAPSSPR